MVCRWTRSLACSSRSASWTACDFSRSAGCQMLGLGPQIREDKDRPRKVGGERFGTIVSGQNAILPHQQVGVAAGELFPALFLSSARHALPNQKDVGPGYGLVIELGLPAGLGKSLQGLGKHMERFKSGILSQI